MMFKVFSNDNAVGGLMYIYTYLFYVVDFHAPLLNMVFNNS